MSPPVPPETRRSPTKDERRKRDKGKQKGKEERKENGKEKRKGRRARVSACEEVISRDGQICSSIA